MMEKYGTLIEQSMSTATYRVGSIVTDFLRLTSCFLEPLAPTLL